MAPQRLGRAPIEISRVPAAVSMQRASCGRLGLEGHGWRNS